MTSIVEVYNSSIKDSVSSKGMFYASDGTNLYIKNSTFDTLVGTDYSAFLFAIQNPSGMIMVENSTIMNCMSASGLISMTFSKLTL